MGPIQPYLFILPNFFLFICYRVFFILILPSLFFFTVTFFLILILFSGPSKEANQEANSISETQENADVSPESVKPKKTGKKKASKGPIVVELSAALNVSTSPFFVPR